ncbi:hypothetical protein A9R05_07560 [Burkholderia sp. KK1]|nr:hypothetical protein A9R05_07310 [Burkholderia sp. KK1]AQG98711.1 hypothetical protein A9R05_07560 [Burkholderia sp. KK1]
MDWKTLGTEIAKLGLPLLGAALPIPGGSALGAALASTIGSPTGQPEDILATLTGNAQALVNARQFEMTHQETMLKITLDAQTAQYQTEVSDRQDARSKLAANGALWWIAALVLVTFAVIMTAVLAGSWTLLKGGITIKDVSVVAAISGLVGSIVGYVAANAQTVINFLFGGSMGNEKNAGALAQSVQTATQALAIGNNTPWSVAAPPPSSAVTPLSISPSNAAAAAMPPQQPVESVPQNVPGLQGDIYKGN